MAVPRRHSKRERLRLVAKASPIAPTATLQALPDARGPPALADDLLVGARAISRFMFGTTKERRRVYWLVETGQIPTFRLGTASLRAEEHNPARCRPARGDERRAQRYSSLA